MEGHVNTDSWQEETISQVTALFSQDENVRGLVLIGSLTRDDVTRDAWSDLDIAVVVRDEALDSFWPATEWISGLGEVYCTSRSSTSEWRVTRACFADGRRIDFAFVTEGSVARIEEWEKNPLRYVNVCLFSRSEALDRALKLEFPPPVFEPASPRDFERMANDFWFKGMLAVSKAAREELLVALHLSLDMVRDCLVLGMMIRDRDTGADHHRDGSQGNHFIPVLEGTRQPHTALGVLDSIEQSAVVFDKLAVQWDAGYRDRREPLLRWIERARPDVRASG